MEILELAAFGLGLGMGIFSALYGKAGDFDPEIGIATKNDG